MEITVSILSKNSGLQSHKIFETRYQSYKVTRGMRAQITEQTRDTNRGGGVIPAVIPWLLTNSKYSRAPTKTAAATVAVNTHPPANTTMPTDNPIPSPKKILFFNWLAFCWCSETASSFIDNLWPLWTSYNIPISVHCFNKNMQPLKKEYKFRSKIQSSRLPLKKLHICNITRETISRLFEIISMHCLNTIKRSNYAQLSHKHYQ